MRIPLTLGALPAKRYEFAEKIGKMVGTHLFGAFLGFLIGILNVIIPGFAG